MAKIIARVVTTAMTPITIPTIAPTDSSSSSESPGTEVRLGVAIVVGNKDGGVVNTLTMGATSATVKKLLHSHYTQITELLLSTHKQTNS